MKAIKAKEWDAVMCGHRLPRKLKKRVLGKRISGATVRRWLRELRVYEPAKTMYESAVVHPHLFCPNCGCTEMRGTGNKTFYPEHWECFYCLRCGRQVAEIDNSPFIHVLEDIAAERSRREAK
jgi:Fe2+ or Zn2+ uptake regulation protein